MNTECTTMYRWLTILSLCISAGSAVDISCEWYPTPEYRDIAMECSGMKVKQLPTMLPRNLELLRLTQTAISSLDNAAFHGRVFSELTSLYVTGGGLTSVEADALCSLPALTMLDLSHNHLHHLDALSFRCNQHLRTINLSQNPSLRHLPKLVSSSVEALYIENCSLTSIDVAALDRMTALKTLSLSGNENLHCSSEKKRLRDALPDILVICEDPVENHHSHLSFSAQQSTQLNYLDHTESITQPTQKDGIASHRPQSEWTMTIVFIFFSTIVHRWYYVQQCKTS